MERIVRKEALVWPLVLAGHAAVFSAVLSMGFSVSKPLAVPVVNVSLVVDELDRSLVQKPMPLPQPKASDKAPPPVAKAAVNQPVKQAATLPKPEVVAAVKDTKQEVPQQVSVTSAEKPSKADTNTANATSTSSSLNAADKSVAEAADAKATKAAEVSSAPKKVSALAYLRAPQPVYPAASRRLNEQGKVVLKVMVDEAGRVIEVAVQESSGFPRLDESARRAVQAALFRPYVESGRPLKAWALVPISFGLVEGGNDE